MKRVQKLVSKVVLVLLAPQLALAQWTDEHEGQLVIRGGWLFDSVSDERRPNTGIVIQDGKIVEVDADVQQQVLSTANIVDMAETDTILPGMIDLHAHYNLDLVDNGRVEEVVYNGIVFLARVFCVGQALAQLPRSRPRDPTSESPGTPGPPLASRVFGADYQRRQQGPTSRPARCIPSSSCA